MIDFSRLQPALDACTSSIQQLLDAPGPTEETMDKRLPDVGIHGVAANDHPEAAAYLENVRIPYLEA